MLGFFLEESVLKAERGILACCTPNHNYIGYNMNGPYVKLSLIRTISGRELELFLKKSSDDLLKRLENDLAEYDGVSVGLQWKGLYRGVEEFVNLFEALNMQESLYSERCMNSAISAV